MKSVVIRGKIKQKYEDDFSPQELHTLLTKAAKTSGVEQWISFEKWLESAITFHSKFGKFPEITRGVRFSTVNSTITVESLNLVVFSLFSNATELLRFYACFKEFLDEISKLIFSEYTIRFGHAMDRVESILSASEIIYKRLTADYGQIVFTLSDEYICDFLIPKLGIRINAYFNPNLINEPFVIKRGYEEMLILGLDNTNNYEDEDYFLIYGCASTEPDYEQFRNIVERLSIMVMFEADSLQNLNNPYSRLSGDKFEEYEEKFYAVSYFNIGLYLSKGTSGTILFQKTGEDDYYFYSDIKTAHEKLHQLNTKIYD